MMRKSPSWRWELVEKALKTATPPDDAFCQEVYSVMTGELEHETILYALDIYDTPTFRDTVMAFFLCGADVTQTVQGTGVDADTLGAFGKLFIDGDVFRNKMEWRAYAEFYAAHCCADESGQKQVMIGMLNGPTALVIHWHRGNEKIALSDQDILTQQLRLAYTKSMVSKNASITDDEAKEALKWGQFAVNSALRRNSLKGGHEIETDAVMAIRKRKATLTAQDIGKKPSDFLH